ncbi:MAG: fibronectin type III domain-containing protein, partial [Salinispira sp.]
MNVQKQTSIIAAVLFVFMLILAACPSAFVYIPNKDDRIPTSAFDNNVERAQKPQWYVRKLGTNDPWEPKAGEVIVEYDVDIIAQSDTPGAVIHYASGETFEKIPNFSSDSSDSNTVTESNPLTLSGRGSKGAYKAAVEAPLVHPSGNSYLIVTISATVPSAPNAPTLTAGNGQLDVAWTEPDDGGSAITAYHLRHSLDGGSNWSDILNVDAPATSHTITGLTNGTEYDVQVRAVNSVAEDAGNGAGVGAWSTSASATPVAVSLAPTAFTLTAGNTTITAAWAAPTDTGGSAITGYELEYKLSSGDWNTPADVTQQTTDADTTTDTIIGLKNGAIYDVRVRAVNAQGNGNWSTSATATPATVPSAPNTLTLAGGNAQLTATWTAPDDGGSAITGYGLQYREVGGEAWTPITSSIIGTNYTIMGLTNGTEYEVQVRAVNSVAEDAGNGAGVGEWSISATETPLIFATQVPSGTATSARISAAVNNQISADNLIVSLTTVTTPTTTVTLPTVNATTGVITVTASTTAGTYLASGVDGMGTEQFSEHFSVTVSPTTNAELDTAVAAGITVWGNTADLNYIVTTAVTDMSEMFFNASTFNGDISAWDTSAVTSMESMFNRASAFNGDISNWNV